MEGAQSVQLEAGIPFDPIVDVASSEKCVIRQSPLFEYRVGTGRLLVCSFRFDKSDPAAKWMRRRLYDYVSSERFQPAQSLSVCELAAVMDAPLVSPDANSNVARNLNDMASSVRDGVWAQP